MSFRRIEKLALLAGVLFSAVTVNACSVQPDPAPEAVAPRYIGPKDEDSPPPPEGPEQGSSASPAAPFPAFMPSAPKVVTAGGKVLTNPVVVTITFPGDANAATYEALGDTIGKSDYWKQITSEYGVGEVTSGTANHVRMKTALPATVTDANRETFITQNIQDGTWPAPTAQTLYLLYVPRGTKLNDETCKIEGGDHQSIVLGDKEVAYAVIADCDGGTVDDVTVTASHEIAEAAVDPFLAPAYIGVGDEIAWEAFQLEQTETGDMCEFLDDYDVRPADLPFAVQRQWSNKAATAGHDPCVPAAPGPYFNVSVLDRPGTLTADLTALGDGAGIATGKGFPMKLGESRTFDIGFYSDAPTNGWSLSALQIDPTADNADVREPAPTKTVDLALDKSSGKNGDHAKLTVTLKTEAKIKASLVVLVSTLGAKKSMTPLLVGGGPATLAGLAGLARLAGLAGLAGPSGGAARRRHASHQRWMTTTSMRRFWARPSFVSFGATGSLSRLPETSMRDASTPRSTSIFLAAAARP